MLLDEVQGEVIVRGFQGDNPPNVPEECKWELPAGQFLRIPDETKLEFIGRCANRVRISGVITTDDGALFEAVIQFFESIDFRAHLNQYGRIIYPDILLSSEGGSITAAIRMGKAIRASEYMQKGQPPRL